MKFCPVCGSSNTQLVKKIETAKLFGSFLYEDIKIKKCNVCSHAFNDFGSIERLKKYYMYEYIQNKFKPSKNINTFLNYDQKNKLNFVVTQNNIQDYVKNILNLNKDFFSPVKYNFIALDQFLEHCWDLRNVINNIKRILIPHGRIYISVPDFESYRYKLYPYFFLIKEHIQHFNIETLKFFFGIYGFKLINSKENISFLFGNQLKMKTIEMIFEYSNNFRGDYPTFFSLLRYLFVASLPLDANSQLYYYGASKECMHYIKNNYSGVEPLGIIDDHPGKNQKYVNDIPIFESSIIPSLPKSTLIIITSKFYKQQILSNLIKLNYKGRIETPYDNDIHL